MVQKLFILSCLLLLINGCALEYGVTDLAANPDSPGSPFNPDAKDWTLVMGDGGTDLIYDTAIDKDRNVYSVGTFSGTVNFHPNGTDIHTSNGGVDMFITKTSHDGSYLWTHTIGGENEDRARQVDVDDADAGNVYFTGYFNGSAVDFDFTSGTDDFDSGGVQDIFITKINSDGNYGWTLILKSDVTDYGRSIKVSSAGDIYVAGSIAGGSGSRIVDMDPTSGVDNYTASGWGDVFVVKLNSDGTYAWHYAAGNGQGEGGRGLGVDSVGNVYVCGWFYNTLDFDPVGTDSHSSNGSHDMHLTKVNADGSYAWTHTFGGTGGDNCMSLTVDNNDDVILAGVFGGSSIDFDPSGGTFLLDSNGGLDTVLAKYDGTGAFVWAKSFGGSGGDVVRDICMAENNEFWIGGYFEGTDVDFDPGSGTTLRSTNGASDYYISRFNSSGELLENHTGGGTNTDGIRGVGCGEGVFSFAGYFESGDVELNPFISDQFSTLGSKDAFVSFFWMN